MFHRFAETSGRVIRSILEGLSEKKLLARSHHKRIEHLVLISRNTAVGLAAVLFMVSISHMPGYHILKAIAYFLGSWAYFCEIALLTDCFSKNVPHQEMFMAYCFGPLYILLGFSYLFGF